MGFRFQRRFKIFPGVRVNLSRSGVSTSIGTKGAHVTLGDGKIRETLSLPGSGLSYTHVEGSHQTQGNALLGADRPPDLANVPREARPLGLGRALAALLVFLLMVAVLINLVRQLW
jgi:hypothetical protein